MKIRKRRCDRKPYNELIKYICTECYTIFLGRIQDNRKFCSRHCSGINKSSKKGWLKGQTKETNEILNKMVLKSSNTRKGKNLSISHRNNIGLGNKGKKSNKKGKTWKEIYGEERAKEIKNKFKTTIKGRSSPMKGKRHTEKSKKIIGEKGKGRKHSEKTKRQLSVGMMGKQYSLGYKHSEETKAKRKEIANRPEMKEISRQIMLKLLEEGKIGWQTLPLESYPEKLYREHLESLGFVKDIDFFQEIQVGHYRLDFTFADKMIDFEIDGRQHSDTERVKHDNKRDAYLKNKGWIIRRLSAKKLIELCRNSDRVKVLRSQVLG